ncbi:uncharacterized protein LOC135843700 [Planococcus citri]|uniref:uncharacterized protein LOC135843700 n=1 Tax=Planococcus citri TaxID=170843 RepID=UPI0031F789A8
MHYLQKMDVHNIIRDYNITYSTRFHKDDVVSVEMLVETLRKQEDSPLLHYNSIYENFSLVLMTRFQKLMLIEHSKKICVDGTHGLNAYGYQLVTVLVIDEFNNGVPVAFCFSKKTDFDAMYLFFDKVKNAVGFPIKSDIFMSDDAPQFFDAWAAVMGKPAHKLLCWWHINKNWTSMLNTKIDNKHKEKRKYVKDALYSLATSLIDTKEFDSRLSVFLKTLEEDEDTRQFYQYFKTYYVPKKSSWAFCYRQHLGLNVNMHLEALHKKIKYQYLNGNHVIRLDKSIDALLRLIRDLMYERIIKIAKEKPSAKMLKIRHAHEKGLKIPKEHVQCLESQLWKVKSQTRDGLVYEVKQVSEMCDDVNLCVLRCSECNVCIHTFKCSCIDSFIYDNLCKHIHTVAKDIKISDEEQELSRRNCSNEEIEKTIDMLRTPFNEEDKYEKIRIEVQSKLRLALTWSKDLPGEYLENLSKTLDTAFQKFGFSRKGEKKENKGLPAANKKLSPQRKIAQWPKKTTKKRIPLMERPSNSGNECALALLTGAEIPNIIGTQDFHSYF